MGKLLFKKKRAGLEEKLNRYLFTFETQERPGLLVVKNRSAMEEITLTLDRNEIHESKTWWALLNRLNSAEPTFYVLEEDLSTELYDIIQQYEARRGTIEVVDQKTREIQKAKCNPRRSRLLLVATERALHKIEQTFPLRARVGLTEIL